MIYRSLQALTVATSLWVAGPVSAQDTSAEILFDIIGLTDIIDIMREEGVTYGAQIGTDLFPDRVGPSWSVAVEAIYDPSKMQSAVKSAFVASLEGDDVDAMGVFFRSDMGRDFVNLEVSARRALLNKATEAASNEIASIARAEKSPRFQLVDQFVQTNDLIETNVVGALNSNYAFYSGLMQGGELDGTMSDAQILSDVWDQEPEIRTSTTDWIYSFLMLAYDPASDADLEAYIAFSQSDAGQQLNTALFDAFDGYFEDISFKLGQEAARMLSGAEL